MCVRTCGSGSSAARRRAKRAQKERAQREDERSEKASEASPESFQLQPAALIIVLSRIPGWIGQLTETLKQRYVLRARFDGPVLRALFLNFVDLFLLEPAPCLFSNFDDLIFESQRHGR